METIIHMTYTIETREMEHSDVHGLRHKLVLDCRRDGHQMDMSWGEIYPRFLSHISAFVCNDRGRHSPIDALRLELEYSPGMALWEALDGLSPRALEVMCGSDEACDLSALKTLETPWPLDSLYIAGASGTQFSIPRIPSLTLDHCAFVTFEEPADCSEHDLTITENDACDIFLNWHSAGLANSIRKLRIQSTGGHDFTHAYLPNEFITILQKCTALVSLDLTLAEGPGFGAELLPELPLYFPPKLPTEAGVSAI